MTWTEVHVVNTKSHVEAWVPRHLVGEVSLIEEPVRIVGLVKELEYKEGVLIPHRRRVLEMPRAVNAPARPLFGATFDDGHVAPVVGIRVESSTKARRSRRIFGWVAAGLLAFIAAALALATIGFNKKSNRLYVPSSYRNRR